MKRLLCVATAVAMFLPVAVRAEEARVIHWWTSGGESDAIKVIADAYKSDGGTWIDQAIAGSDSARLAATNAISGGQPPTMAQFNISNQFRELAEASFLRSLDDVAADENWQAVLPGPILDVITVDGHIYAAPVNIHNPAWIWYSTEALQKAQVSEPPTTKNAFFTALDKLKSAGIIPLALGGQPWQERATFDAVLLHFGGKDMYMNFIGGNGAALVQTPEFKQVLADFKRLKGYVDEGSPNRSWNEATALVIENKAGFQIMGDWAKGEFKAAGDTAGKEYGCIVGFGDKPSYMIAGDVFIFPKSNESDTAAQTHLAKLMLSPKVQVDFNNLKGSIPVRAGVDGSNMDVCAQAGLAAVSDPSRQVPNPEMRLSPDAHGMVTDAISNFWNTDQSVDEAVAALQSALSM
ncbi:sugar ABC transporter, substrate-binding protein [Sinorhizobium fredii NGR234]|uniref:Probable sugar-binding periplasmic protein n=1 Tax=Sinorhizobium fredii (strain NBRC 101917 / NGR234) TaxID=394 RepID=C3MIB2_SINFN|nr:ABC transporter substrate-binding protein [Sinorhizobium fredii]ACP24460.1 sugar ABC transporter, substrate-binding protein [Sinorhizobium fredii NGR234]UTY48540.1 carbohydrate ABC transporter substrate-binding protein [Sinorhizobium fredii]